MNPEWLRYYIAAKLNAQVEDIDFNPDDFVARVNSDLVGKYINIASRAAGFLDQALRRQAVGRPRRRRPRAARRPARAARRRSRELYDEREYGKALREIMAAGRPGQRVRRPEQALGAGQAGRAWTRALHDVCTRLHRGLPPADDLPEAGAAGAGRAGRGLPADRAAARWPTPRTPLGAPRASATTST